MLEHGATMRKFAEQYAASRERMGLPPVDVERIVIARAVEVVIDRLRRIDLLTSRDVAAASRATQAMVREYERCRQFEQFLATLVKHTRHHYLRLVEEAAFENQARRVRGRKPIETESLVVQLAMHEVTAKTPTDHLAIGDSHRAGQAVRAQLVSSSSELINGRLRRFDRRPIAPDLGTHR